MTRLRRLIVLVKVSRPVGWVLLPTIFITGFYTPEVPTSLFFHPEFAFLPFIQALLLSFPASLIGYGINDIYDRESDIRNPRKRRGSIDGETLDPDYFHSIKIASLAMATLLLVSSISTLEPANLVLMMTVLFLSYAYSAPPIRLKARPPLDSLSNGILYGYGPFALGYGYNAPLASIEFK